MSNKNKIINIAIEGNISELKSLLKKGEKVPKGILQKVIFSGWHQGENTEVLEILVEAGAEINPLTGETPLYSAAMVGPFPSRSLATTNFLLNNGADPNLKSNWEYPLHLAVTTIANNTVKRLIEGGANINAIADDGETATHKCLKAYYDFIGDDFNSKDEEKYAKEDAEICVLNTLKHLLLVKPDLSIKNKDGKNPLTSVIALRGYPEQILQKLIDANNPPNGIISMKNDDLNVLSVALLKKYSSKFILQIFKMGNDATILYDIFRGENAITVITILYPELALDFFKFQPKLVHSVTSKGNGMFYCATKSGNINLMQYLIEQGVDPNYVGDNNKTALKYAEEMGYESAVKFLKALK